MGTRIPPRAVRILSGSLTAAAAAGIAAFVWVHVRQTNREVAVSATAPVAPQSSGREPREARASREAAAGAPTSRGAEAADFVPIPFPKSPLEFYVRLLQSGDARDRAFAKDR